MGVEYGKYNFDNLGVKTYHQFLAQPKRLSTDGRQSNTSVLYEKYLIPRLQKTDSAIDIGAGRMAYVKLLKSKGYNMHAYEPSLMVKGANKLDMKGIIANILNAEKEVKRNGLFDWCVLEAVINSVVDDDFEKAVLTTCNAVLKSTGTLITCTRNIAYVEKAYEKTKLSAGAGDCLWYLDDKNYTLGGILRGGSGAVLHGGLYLLCLFASEAAPDGSLRGVSGKGIEHRIPQRIQTQQAQGVTGRANRKGCGEVCLRQGRTSLSSGLNPGR